MVKKRKGPRGRQLTTADSRVQEARDLLRRDETDEAARLLQVVMKERPRDGFAHHAMGLVALSLSQLVDAELLFKRAIELGARTEEIYRHLGICLHEMGRYTEGLEVLRTALKRDPKSLWARFYEGRCLVGLGRYDEALAPVEASVRQDPDNPVPLHDMLSVVSQLCLWDRVPASIEAVVSVAERQMRAGQVSSLGPFTCIVHGMDADLHRRVAQSWSRSSRVKPVAEPRPLRSKDRLHVAYISPDLCSHPVGLLMKPLFMHHDASRVQVTALSLRTVRDPIQDAIRASAETFVDARTMSDDELFQWIRDQEVDVLVDCCGFTAMNRNTVISRRPAPVQAHYLGYPGTVGAALVDYQLTVRARDPVGTESNYDEALAFLPETFVAVDELPRPRELPEREDFGIPTDRPVLGFLGAHYRIEPGVWAAWRTILQRCPDAVLVLRGGPGRPQLEAHAEAAGFRDRVIFTPDALLTKAWHQVMLDLYLDTFRVTAGTGGIITAFSGVPIVTVRGGKPESRTGAAVLEAAGLPELVLDSPEGYVERVVELVRGGGLADLRREVARRRAHAPLFHPERFARTMENAFEEMWQRALAGERPESFDVKAPEGARSAPRSAPPVHAFAGS